MNKICGGSGKEECINNRRGEKEEELRRTLFQQTSEVAKSSKEAAKKTKRARTPVCFMTESTMQCVCYDAPAECHHDGSQMEIIADRHQNKVRVVSVVCKVSALTQQA